MDSAIQQPKSTTNSNRKFSSNDDESKSRANGVDRDSLIAVSAYYKPQARCPRLVGFALYPEGDSQ